MLQTTNPFAGSIAGLAMWKSEQPGYQEWCQYMGTTGKSAEKMAGGLLKTSVFDICQYTQEDIPSACNDIMNGNSEVIYGICDEYHCLHLEALRWISTYIDTPKSKINNVLDYYGKNGEFAFRAAKLTNCNVTYVDQDPWANYAKFRFRIKDVHHRVKTVTATPAQPRPDFDKRFGFIMTPDVPQEYTEDYMKWLGKHIFPYGLIACKAKLPLKLVAELPAKCHLYQATPD